MNPAATEHREIERRFLVEAIPANLDGEDFAIDQGYITDKPTVRLRRENCSRFFLTVKRGPFVAHEEREIELTMEQFFELWPLTEGHRLHKIRRRIPWNGHIIELDTFAGQLEGLRIAEVEFSDDKSMWDFEKPAWFGKEVTGDASYANVNLARS